MLEKFEMVPKDPVSSRKKKKKLSLVDIKLAYKNEIQKIQDKYGEIPPQVDGKVP